VCESEVFAEAAEVVTKIGGHERRRYGAARNM
jgi:hypothetical protein